MYVAEFNGVEMSFGKSLADQKATKMVIYVPSLRSEKVMGRACEKGSSRIYIRGRISTLASIQFATRLPIENLERRKGRSQERLAGCKEGHFVEYVSRYSVYISPAFESNMKVPQPSTVFSTYF